MGTAATHAARYRLVPTLASCGALRLILLFGVGIAKRHSQVFVVGDRLETFGASVSVSSGGSAVKSSREPGHVADAGGGHQAEPYGGAGLCARRVGHRSTKCVHGLVQVVPEAVGGHCVLSRGGEQRLSALFLGAVCCRRA